MIDILLWRI